MAERSGFFNALKAQNGTYDIKYSAQDWAAFIGAIISNGVRRSGDDDLRVIASGGFALTINVGWAVINGRWYQNDAIYTNFSVPTPPVGDRSRIDRIVLRLDTSIDQRRIRLAYLQGEPAAEPQAPALTRTATIYELAIADINVPAAAGSINQNNITDQRGNGPTRDIKIGEDKDGNSIIKTEEGDNLCGWITTPVGYDGFFATLDNKFNSWFQLTRDRVASVTMYREYHQRITTEATTSAVTFSIPQYDNTNVDIVKVYVNGLLAVEGIDYTLAGSVITFTTQKVGGTNIDVTVVKSIDGTGLGSVQSAVEELQEEVSTFKNIGDYIYLCNGYDDNVKLTEIAQDFLTDTNTTEGTLTISVYGTFGANAPYSGTGESTSRYRWMILGSESTTPTKRVVFDFLNCSPMTFTGEAGKHYICIHGNGVEIRNATIIARQRNTEGSVVVFSASRGEVHAERCRFDVSAYQGSNIAQTGTFVDCAGTVTNSRADSYCFDVNTDGLLRVRGGEYTAYTGLAGSASAVIRTASTAINAAVFADGVNCPTIAKSNHYQKNAILPSSGRGYVVATITTLTMGTATNWTIAGTIPLSKPNLG